MYAVIKTGGKQYKVQEGDIIRVEKLNADVGSLVTFDEVLAISDDNGLKVGSHVLEGAKVEANVLKQGKKKSLFLSLRVSIAENKGTAPIPGSD